MPRRGKGKEQGTSPLLRLSSFWLIFSLFPLLSCTSTPKLADYPSRQIDRPAVLPEGVSSWSPFFARSLDPDRHSYLYPFRWEQGYTERLSLVWMPLPFQARYRLQQDDQGWWVLEGAFLGPVESRDRNFDWRPRLEIQGFRRFHESLAWTASVFGQFEVKRVAEPKLAKTWGLGSGVHVQLTDRLALKTQAWIWNETGFAWAHYLGEIPQGNQGPADVRQARWRYPLEAQVAWSFGPRWEASGRVIWYRLGYESGDWSAPLYLTVTHRW